MKIGIFDSGIGGLTVLKEMIKYHPNAHYIYYGDTINLPYGEKTKDELEMLVDKIIKFLISKNVDLIIIACGTISSNLYDDIKDKYGVKIIDVLTPTIDYIKKNQLENIGVLGTNMTVKSKSFEKGLGNIKSIACPKFAPAIESGSSVSEAAKEYLEYLNGCANIVLGCTHYPIIVSELKKYTNSNFINMGKCVAESIDVAGDTKLEVELHFSAVDEQLKANTNSIIGNYDINLTRL